MIDHQSLPLFLSAVIALLVVPGPDMLLISAQSIQRGAKFGVACSVGVMLAGAIQTVLVSLGLGHVMETWPFVATIVRLIGAAYLAYLGLKLLVAWRNSDVQQEDPRPEDTHRSITSLIAVGMANNLLNPKALLFFSLFLPQFINPAIGSPALQLASLGLLLTFLAFAFNVLASIMFASLRSLRIDSPRIRRHSGGVLGLLFVLLASKLAVAKAAP